MLTNGVQGSPCRGYRGVPMLVIKGCRGLPAGGMGVSPIYPFFSYSPSPLPGERGLGGEGFSLPLRSGGHPHNLLHF